MWKRLGGVSFGWVRVGLGLVDKEVGICGGGKWRIGIGVGIGIWSETRGGKDKFNSLSRRQRHRAPELPQVPPD